MRRVGTKLSGIKQPEFQGAAEDEQSRRLGVREREERDRVRHSRLPQNLEEVRFWASRAVWPEE
jgi:hypothetical protein